MEPGSTRRTFLRVSVAGSGLGAPAARELGANERIRLGIIGTGSRGQYLMKCVGKVPGTEWAAVCDVYDVRRRQAVKLSGGVAEECVDYRQVLDRKDVDAVLIATPDHWHGPMAAEACRAGKDVYIEKPMTCHPEEGLAIIREARRNKRVVQVGLQQRTGPHYLEAKRTVIDPGLLGKVGLVRMWYNANAGFIEAVPDGFETKPDGLDWNRYLGPAPKVPWNPARYFNRFAYWDITPGGQIGGLYVHLVDTVHWYLGLHRAMAAVAAGGIYHFADGRDTPDVVNTISEYPEKLNVTFEAELLTAGMRRTVPTAGIEFHGTGGVLTVYRDLWDYGYVYVPNPKSSGSGELRGQYYRAEAQAHVENWIDCVRTRQQPATNEVAGHYSALAGQMAMMAYRKRARVEWNPKWEVPA